MTMYPKYLTDFPNMHSDFPFHLSINSLKNGYPAHRHDYLEFSYVIEGHGSEVINGVIHPMKPGTFTLVLPYEIHEIHTEPGDELQLYNCMFGMNMLLGTFANIGLSALLLEVDEHVPPYAQLEDHLAQTMMLLLERMYNEYLGNGNWKNALLGAGLIETLALFDRSRSVTFPPKRKHPETAASGRIWGVIHYVHTHYSEELTLTEIAEKFHFSVSHLSELFKKYVGQNFVHFLHELRLRHAMGLLRSTEMNIADIAYEVGFGSYQTFSRTFRELKHMTPANYRKHTALSADK
jgi:AraC-like DNA-binding protein